MESLLYITVKIRCHCYVKFKLWTILWKLNKTFSWMTWLWLLDAFHYMAESIRWNTTWNLTLMKTTNRIHPVPLLWNFVVTCNLNSHSNIVNQNCETLVKNVMNSMIVKFGCISWYGWIHGIKLWCRLKISWKWHGCSPIITEDQPNMQWPPHNLGIAHSPALHPGIYVFLLLFD